MSDINLNPDTQAPVLNATEIYEMGDPPPVNIRATSSLKAGMLFGPEDSAPGENLFNVGMVAASSTPTAQAPAPPVPVSASTNIFDQGLSSSSARTQYPAPSSTIPPGQTAASSENLFNVGLGQTKGIATSQSPVNGQPASDPNAGLLKKGWTWLNEPLIKGSTIQNAIGVDPNDTGVTAGAERGGSNIVAGLTSPLSLILTLGTFGTGAVEGVGASVLREAGLSAGEIADATKSASVLKDALSNGHSVEEGMQAVTDAGFDADKLQSALRTLDDSGVTHDALTSENIFRKVTGNALKSAGVDAGDADTFSKYISAGVGAGFSVQQLHQAAVASPRVLDSIKDGDYGHAAELATEALASGVLGYAGARTTIHEVGDLVPQAEAALGMRVKPSEETRKLINEFGVYDADVARSARDAKLFTKAARANYPDIADDPIRLHRVKNLIEAGLDADKMTDRFNSLARASGRNEEIPRLDELIGSQAPERETVADTHALGFAPERISQLEQEHKIQDSYTPAEIDDLLSAFDSRELRPEDYELAKTLKDRYAQTLTVAQQAGALKDGVEAYTSNLWEEPDNPALNRLRSDMQTNGSFTVNTSMARQRAFANSYEGLLAGYKLKPEARDPITTSGFNAAQFGKIIAARKTLDRLQSKNIVGSDGRPMLAPSGTGPALTNEDGEPLATLVNPNAVRSIRIAQPVIDKLRSSGDLQRFLDEGKIVQLDRQSRSARLHQPLTKQGSVPLTPEEREWVSDVGTISGQPKPVYAWQPFDYKSGDSPVLKDWNFAANDTAGNPVTLLSELKIHPEAYDYLQRRLGGNESAIRKSSIGRAALGVAGELKGILLGGLSPFHAVQTAGRALLAGVSPFVALDKWDLADPILYRAVEHGLTLPAGSDLKEFEAGSLASHSKLLSKIPILGPLQDSLNNFLFRDYIPSLKAKAFPAVLAKMREANPNWTEGKLFEESASYVNDLFGGQNWKRLGASAASEDFQKLFLLAPDWLRSEINLAARLVRPGQRVSQADALKMTAGLWAAARVGNMLVNNGQMHLETPFAISTTDKEGRQKLFSVRTLPTDLLHLVQDPRGFGLNRMSPLARTGLQVVTGRDEYGRKIPAPTFFGNLLANSLPISAQTFGKAIAGETPEVTSEDQVLKALGATVYRYKTEAGKLADQLASDRAPSGLIPDPAMLRYHLAILHLEDQLRTGEISMADIAPAVQSGDLSVQDFHKISENFKRTYQMSQPIARLYVRAASLPLKDFLKVWDVATPSERVTLIPLFHEKRKSYLKALPPSKRDTDPLARQVAAIFGR